MLSTFLPQFVAQLYRVEGYTPTGEDRYSEPYPVGISPIRMEASIQPTSIRADKSGSKSRADEATFVGRILVEPDADIKKGYVIEFHGEKYKIVSVWPRYDMANILHHFQVDLTAWLD